MAGGTTSRLRAGSTLGPVGLGVTATPAQRRTVKLTSVVSLALIGLIIALASLGIMPIDAIKVSHAMLQVEFALAVLYFAYLFFFAGLDRDEMKRTAVIGVLFLFAAVFWAGFEQAPSSLNTFADKFTDRVIFGFEVPYEWLQTVNSLCIVFGAPVFAWIWVTLGKKGIVPSSPTKFSFGLLLGGLGFLVMMPAVNSVVGSAGAVKVSMWWLIISYVVGDAPVTSDIQTPVNLAKDALARIPRP